MPQRRVGHQSGTVFRRGENGPMHDDRDLVEERISRELSERIVSLVHPERRPLDVEAGASLDDVATFEVGARRARRGRRRGSGSAGRCPVPGAASGSRRCSISDSAWTLPDSSARVSCATRRADRCRASIRAGTPSGSPACPGRSCSSSRPPPTRPSPSSGLRRWGPRTPPARGSCTGSSGPSSWSSTQRRRRCCTTSTCSTV